MCTYCTPHHAQYTVHSQQSGSSIYPLLVRGLIGRCSFVILFHSMKHTVQIQEYEEQVYAYACVTCYMSEAEQTYTRCMNMILFYHSHVYARTNESKTDRCMHMHT